MKLNKSEEGEGRKVYYHLLPSQMRKAPEWLPPALLPASYWPSSLFLSASFIAPSCLISSLSFSSSFLFSPSSCLLPCFVPASFLFHLSLPIFSFLFLLLFLSLLPSYSFSYSCFLCASSFSSSCHFYLPASFLFLLSFLPSFLLGLFYSLVYRLFSSSIH